MFCLELAAGLCPIRIRRQSGPGLKPGVFSRDLPRARVSMAGLERNWTRTLAFAVLLMGAGTAGFTQSRSTLPAEDTTTGSLTGKLTDLYSRPLEGVPVVVRNQATGAETRTITTKNGFYRFSRLEPGEYTVTAESPQLGRGQLEDIAVAAGYEARVKTLALAGQSWEVIAPRAPAIVLDSQVSEARPGAPVTSAPRTAAQWTGFGRLDWEAAERHHFTLEGIGALWNSPGGGLTRVSETYGNHSFGSSKASEEWLL